jgi:AP-1 complex subunit beta-1
VLQESDNPDLRDRGYIYWRLLLTDPAAAKVRVGRLRPGRKRRRNVTAVLQAVVLCEKPLISEETDLLEPSLLDELICHISSLASVFHKPPSSFVEGRVPGRRVAPAALFEENPDLLGLEEPMPAGAAGAGAVGDLLGDLTLASGTPGLVYVPPKQRWLDSEAGKGLEISGTFARRGGQMYMEMTFTNHTAQAMGDFAIQFNKNSFGLAPAAALNVPTLKPNDAFETSLALSNCELEVIVRE